MVVAEKVVQEIPVDQYRQYIRQLLSERAQRSSTPGQHSEYEV